MGTVVTIDVVGRDPAGTDTVAREDAIDRAVGWFLDIEALCTRFDARSELMQLTTQVGVPVRVSPLLHEVVRFALAAAEASDGAFDPTVGHVMEMRGFNREHRTGQRVDMIIDSAGPVSYRDVHLDADGRTVTLRRPLRLDLGAVAKGLAVDMAARELRPYRDFAIDAGGDLHLAGRNAEGTPWAVGIRHPRRDGELIDVVWVSDMAVCTSGDYERPSAADDGHHILDPRTGTSASDAASVTVVAATAMVADALATAAFVLGPRDGIRFLEQQGVQGLIVTPTLERHLTTTFRSDNAP